MRLHESLSFLFHLAFNFIPLLSTLSVSRLSNDLSDAGSELTLTKRKLADCQQEVERMKSQLREYVQEIQRAEELLCVKVIRFQRALPC